MKVREPGGLAAYHQLVDPNAETPDPQELSHPFPKLPQFADMVERERREFEIAVARTAYNYMYSYLPGVPLAANCPPKEAFSLGYKALVAGPLEEIGSNFLDVVNERLEAEIMGDLFPEEGREVIREVMRAIEEMREQFDGASKLNVLGDVESIIKVIEAIGKVPPELEKLSKETATILHDLRMKVRAMESMLAQLPYEGVTVFLRDTLYDVLHDSLGEGYLEAKTLAEYDLVYRSLPLPKARTLATEPWMELAEGQAPWMSDWYFGWLQIAGFNTSQLKGVFVSTDAAPDPAEGIALDVLQAKTSIDDALLQAVLAAVVPGAGGETLESAAAAGRLYALDYAQFEGAACSVLHGKQRYLAAPIALFYYTEQKAKGYPTAAPAQGSLVPIAIQLGQAHDPERCPLFTSPAAPAAAALTGVQDPSGHKWLAAKFHVNHACAVQHEAVAHLADCHLTIEPIAVAANRTLPQAHPIHALLWPHFRFTIAINASALHSLVIPGSVVASVLSPTIQTSLALVRASREAYHWDDRCPTRLFGRRGLDTDRLPNFPFRDDTMLVWDAIHRFVADYLDVYYHGDQDVLSDPELQAFVAELVDPERGAVRGMNGLIEMDGKPTIASKAYLIDVIAQIIYVASAQHASVNFAQYPLMSYLPSVSGTAYRDVPTRDDAFGEAEYLETLPPIDVGLYQLSFGWLLSALQYDRLGYYTANPRRPYFQDTRVHPARDRFQAALATAEATIRQRNFCRPLAFEMQIPSFIPNSISI